MSNNYKFPIWKVIIFISLFITNCLTLTAFDLFVHPILFANLAVNQFNDSNVAAITIRVYGCLQNFLYPLNPLGLILFIAFGLVLFHRDLLQLRQRHDSFYS
jgi:hypothetical protein